MEGINKILWHQEKGAVTHKRQNQTCLGVSRSLWLRCRSTVDCFRVKDTEYNSPGRVGINPFEGVHYYHYHSLTSGQATGQEHSPIQSTEKWIKELLSMALPIRARPSFPHSQCLQSENFHKPLILIHQRADRMKTTITEN